METYIRRFETRSEYESYMSSSEALLPNVSVCDDEKLGTVFYNSNVEGPQPLNEIWYTSTDGKVVEISDRYEGVEVISNIYRSGKGIVTFAEDVTEIGNFLFYECDTLKTVKIPEGKIAIFKSYAFKGCTNLELINIPQGVGEVEQYALYKCEKLEHVDLPSSLLIIGNYAFMYCSNLKSVELPENIRAIGDNVFAHCNSLAELVLPENTEHIGGVFCRLPNQKNVIIPKNINQIYDSVCQYSSNVEKIVVDSENVKFDSRDNCNGIIETNKNIFIGGCKTSFIPEGITELSYSAFEGIYTLKNIELPDSLRIIRGHAFYKCTLLENMTIPSGVTTIEQSAFYDCNNLKVMTFMPTTPPTLSTSNPISKNTEIIYVPKDAVEAYKTAESWLKYVDLIRPIPTFENLLQYSTTDGISHVVMAEVIKNSLNKAYSKADLISILTFEFGYSQEDAPQLATLLLMDGQTVESLVNIIGGGNEHSVELVSNFVENKYDESGGTLVFSEGYELTYIDKFVSNAMFETVIIPNTIELIGNKAFNNCESLSTVTVKATTPPNLEIGAIPTSINAIYVPSESVNEYKTFENWSEYTDKILPIA